ncbi:hypothetical protein PAPYR_2066 [Paratrimastix pyriformis]|uniref:Uncharacterized protein n=1 Tax=Paratrimastix pyriformis TaxID=342808 RepID=A0ABQ8UQP5_9EUKA|nr:hypothetical protein PAPYR_2066 [Paratrimastix pyriformis]
MLRWWLAGRHDCEKGQLIDMVRKFMHLLVLGGPLGGGCLGLVAGLKVGRPLGDPFLLGHGGHTLGGPHLLKSGQLGGLTPGGHRAAGTPGQVAPAEERPGGHLAVQPLAPQARGPLAAGFAGCQRAD